MTKAIKLILAAFLLLPCTPQAQENESTSTMAVLVKADFDHSSANGLIISSDGMVAKKATEVKRINEREVIVYFPVSSADLQKDSTATAVVRSEKNTAFGNIRALSNPYVELPACPRPVPPRELRSSQFELLESLIDIRKQLLINNKSKVSQILSGSEGKRIMRFEKAFGLKNDQPLTGELDAIELIDRFSRLIEVINYFDTHKAKRKANSNSSR